MIYSKSAYKKEILDRRYATREECRVEVSYGGQVVSERVSIVESSAVGYH